MKKRYLFPLVYIMLFALSFLFPKLGDILLVFFESVVALIILGITLLVFDDPRDTYYLVILGTIIQFFLVGFTWDKIEEKFGVKQTGDKI